MEHEDCIVNMKFQDSLLLLPDKSVQLCFTSPPYEDMVTYRGKDKGVYYSGKLGYEHIQTYWVELFEYMRRPMRDDGIVIIVINDKMSSYVKSISNYLGLVIICSDMGWNLVDHVAWLKLYGIPKGQNVLQDWWEHIYILAKTPDYKYHADRIRGRYSETTRERYQIPQRKIHNLPSRVMSKGGDIKDHEKDLKKVEVNQEGKRMPNVITCAPDQRSGSIHPARFPIDLPLWGITLCTDIGDLVIDPMCGSGTTLMAAKLMDRRYFGSDMGADFVSEAEDSISKTARQEDLFNDETFGIRC